MYQSWYRSILFSRGTTFNTLLIVEAEPFLTVHMRCYQRSSTRGVLNVLGAYHLSK